MADERVAVLPPVSGLIAARITLEYGSHEDFAQTVRQRMDTVDEPTGAVLAMAATLGGSCKRLSKVSATTLPRLCTSRVAAKDSCHLITLDTRRPASGSTL